MRALKRGDIVYVGGTLAKLLRPTGHEANGEEHWQVAIAGFCQSDEGHEPQWLWVRAEDRRDR